MHYALICTPACGTMRALTLNEATLLQGQISFLCRSRHVLRLKGGKQAAPGSSRTQPEFQPRRGAAPAWMCFAALPHCVVGSSCFSEVRALRMRLEQGCFGVFNGFQTRDLGLKLPGWPQSQQKKTPLQQNSALPGEPSPWYGTHVQRSKSGAWLLCFSQRALLDWMKKNRNES